MNSGDLQWRATIKRETGADDLGRRENSFATNGGTFRCSIADRGASETEWGDGTAVVRNYEVRARWDVVVERNLTERDRLLIEPGNILLRIGGITNEGLADRVAVIEGFEVIP